METLVAYKRLNQWDNSSIRPGPVGSVGDTLGQVRFKHSFPDQGIRLDPKYIGNTQNRLGSNVSDGNHKSFTTGGRGDPLTIDEPWNANRAQQVSHGTIFQDMRAPDKLHEPYLGSLPQYSWQNKLATVYNAKRTGNMFLPLPGPYMLSPGEVPRGGQIPIMTRTEGTSGINYNQENLGLQTSTSSAYNATDEYEKQNAYYSGVRQKYIESRPNVTRTKMM